MSLNYFETKEIFQATAFEFITVELELAITFAIAAKSSVSTAAAKQRHMHARKAFGSAMRVLSKADLDIEMAEYLNQKIARLRDLFSALR